LLLLLFNQENYAMAICNDLKQEALDVLMNETFSYTKKEMAQKHLDIGKRNSQLRGTDVEYFMCDGIIYPLEMYDGTPTAGCNFEGITTLHFSLMEELQLSNAWMSTAGYERIKNYFAAVLSASFNGIVLDELLLPSLVNKLRRHFKPDQFKSVNLGVVVAGNTNTRDQ
jgi:hypothetical protein